MRYIAQPYYIITSLRKYLWLFDVREFKMNCDLEKGMHLGTFFVHMDIL